MYVAIEFRGELNVVQMHVHVEKGDYQFYTIWSYSTLP